MITIALERVVGAIRRQCSVSSTAASSSSAARSPRGFSITRMAFIRRCDHPSWRSPTARGWLACKRPEVSLSRCWWTLAAISPNVLTVYPSIPARTVKELIAEIKANPSKYSFASAGLGTTPHLSGELFKLSQGLDLVRVPFRSRSDSDGRLFQALSWPSNGHLTMGRPSKRSCKLHLGQHVS